MAHGILRPLGAELDALEVRETEARLLLPCRSGRPLPSPELAAEDWDEEAPHQWGSWRVTGMELAPLGALSWLVGVSSPESGGRTGLRLGADLGFWAHVALFALELLARQRFVPNLVLANGDGVPLAYWEPLLEDEHDRLELLTEAMPPVCRSIADADPAANEPRALIESFVTVLVDSFVRGAASRLRLRPRFVETTGAQFAAALLDTTGAFPESEDVARMLESELDEWKQGLEEETATGFRMAFRLESPGGEEETSGNRWTLRYFLQAVDDPSLLVPVQQIWQHSGTTWWYLERRMDRPQEHVLEGLARASALFSPIEESLKESRPEHCLLDLEEAYTFLTETAFLLQESGFGVLVPSWWERREEGLSLRLRVAPARDPGRVDSGVGLNAVVQFDWEVALGAEKLDREEFLKLVELKQPLVQVRGRWIELSQEHVQEALGVLRSQPSRPEMSLGEVLHLKLGRKGHGGLPVAGLEAEGWIQDLLDKLSRSASMPQVEPPQGFRGTLRPYQVGGLSWLSFLGEWGLGACLADDMGLGKTIQVLALLLHQQQRGKLSSPYLLICPTSVVSNWRKEAERFSPSLRVLVHHGLGRHEGESFREEAARHDLVVSTYSLVHRDLEHLRSVEWDGLVLDEAQNIKNPVAKQTQALRRLRAPIRIALTGTPVENRLSELWSIMEFLNPGYLGSQLSFKRHFAVPIERYRDTTAAEELRRLVEPFVLRRVKTDPKVIRDLPDKNEMKVYCNLTREQATLYEAIVRESMIRIEGAEGMARRGEVLATLTRLKQVCNHPAHYLGDESRMENRSGKLNRLTEMMEEVLAEGDQALVFTQFAEMGSMLAEHLRELLSVDVLYLHGGVPARHRERMIARFQDDSGGPPIFVLSLKAGGFGLNLTRARHVFHFDRWWNPAVEDQATDRAFRIGQTMSVAVHKLICAGTVEEHIDNLIEQKKELADMVIRSGEAWLTELSTDDLREIFTLRREAVQD